MRVGFSVGRGRLGGSRHKDLTDLLREREERFEEPPADLAINSPAYACHQPVSKDAVY